MCNWFTTLMLKLIILLLTFLSPTREKLYVFKLDICIAYKLFSVIYKLDKPISFIINRLGLLFKCPWRFRLKYWSPTICFFKCTNSLFLCSFRDFDLTIIISSRIQGGSKVNLKTLKSMKITYRVGWGLILKWLRSSLTILVHGTHTARLAFIHFNSKQLILLVGGLDLRIQIHSKLTH